MMLAVTLYSSYAQAAATPASSPKDIHQQFQPAKDDDGDDYAESQELLYQWIDPRYSQDERTQTGGIAAYFAVLGASLCYGRVIAGRKKAQAR